MSLWEIILIVIVGIMGNFSVRRVGISMLRLTGRGLVRYYCHYRYKGNFFFFNNIGASCLYYKGPREVTGFFKKYDWDLMISGTCGI